MERTSPLSNSYGWRTIGLWLSLILWLWKGISYALLGRYWILLGMLALTMLIFYSRKRQNGLYRKLIGLWGMYLMLWGIIRLVLGSLILISPISDLHVNQHFGWLGNIYSTCSLLLGYELFRRSRASKNR